MAKLNGNARWIIPVLVTIAIFLLGGIVGFAINHEGRIKKSEIVTAVLNEKISNMDKKIDEILDAVKK